MLKPDVQRNYVSFQVPHDQRGTELTARFTAERRLIRLLLIRCSRSRASAYSQTI